ncbi:porin family protein [Burkholderia diffusa]|nr:porin family protein [Burkholderia diffusa]
MRHQSLVSTLFIMLSSTLCTGAAHAQLGRAADGFWYLGGDIGYARDKFSTDRAGWSGTSSSNATVGLRGGYQFSRYFSVESTLSSLGSVEAKSASQKDKFSLGAWSANAVGHLPITDRFALLGIAGIGWELGRRRGDIESRNRSAGMFNLGLGAAYDITPNWRARVQYMNYKKLSWKGVNDASVKAQTFTVGVDYLFR